MSTEKFAPELLAENERLRAELAAEVVKRKEYVRTVADAVKLDLPMFTAGRVLEQVKAQSDENERLKKQLHDARAAIEAIETFAAKVAGGSSWWDDVWCAHQAVLDGVCESVRDYDAAQLGGAQT